MNCGEGKEGRQTFYNVWLTAMKKFFPENLFDLSAFEKICPARQIVHLANFDVEKFIERQNIIIHIDENEPYPFDVEFNDAPKYCGVEDDLNIYRITFGAQKNPMLIAVDANNWIVRISISADMSNPAAVESFAGVITIILRNIGMNVEEIQIVNQMIQNDDDLIFHWCEEAGRFMFLNSVTEENTLHIGFFAAIE